MSRAAFHRAELARRHPGGRRATPRQYTEIEALAKQLGMETPSVFWQSDAAVVIERLKGMAQPRLEGFQEAVAT